MKRIIIALSLVLALILSLAACGNSTESTPNTSSTIVSSTDSSSLEPKPMMEKYVSDEEAIKLFRENPQAEVNGFHLSDNGSLSRPGGTYVGDIHTINTPAEDYRVIFTLDGQQYLLDESTNVMYVYSYGSLVKSVELGSNAVYCGWSEGNGFLYRVEDKAYLLDLEFNKELIATGVEFVITSSFYHSSDAWSQPLFLMEDGSLKTYIRWEDELCDFWYEGGYGGTYVDYNY